jgi:hypothetical protein
MVAVEIVAAPAGGGAKKGGLLAALAAGLPAGFGERTAANRARRGGRAGGLRGGIELEGEEHHRITPALVVEICIDITTAWTSVNVEVAVFCQRGGSSSYKRGGCQPYFANTRDKRANKRS